MELVENDFDVVKCKTLLTVNEINEDVYDSSLQVAAEEFAYLEIFEND